MSEDGDRLLTLVGIALAAFIAFAIGTGILAAMNAESYSSADPPAVEWTTERINATHVRIVHAGSEPIDAAEVVVSVDGIDREVGWSGRLEEGDAGEVRARRGQIIRVYWTGGSGDRIMLASWNQ